MCIDSVVVTLTSQAMRVDQYNGSTSGSGDTGSAEESLILLPVVTEEGISLVLGPPLLIPHTPPSPCKVDTLSPHTSVSGRHNIPTQ